MDHPNDQKREDHPLHAELICRQSSDLKGCTAGMNALHRTLQKLVDEAVENRRIKHTTVDPAFSCDAAGRMA